MAALLDEALGTLVPDAAMWAADNSEVLLKLKKGAEMAESLLQGLTETKDDKPHDLIHSLPGSMFVMFPVCLLRCSKDFIGMNVAC